MSLKRILNVSDCRAFANPQSAFQTGQVLDYDRRIVARPITPRSGDPPPGSVSTHSADWWAVQDSNL